MFQTEKNNFGTGIPFLIRTLNFYHGYQSGVKQDNHLVIGSRRQTCCEHHHEVLEILLVRYGTLYVEKSGVSYTLREGDGIVINPFEVHSALMELADERLTYQVLLMDMRFFIPPLQCGLGDRIRELLNGSFRLQGYLPASEPSAQRLSELMQANTPRGESMTAKDECDAMSAGYRLLGMLLEQRAETATPPSKSLQFVGRVSDYIVENYTSAISTVDISAALGYNLTHFCHLFRANFADSFTAYLCKYRIMRAAVDYKDSRMPIGEIAEAVGFGDYCHFSRSFKRYIGVAPSKYFRGK